LIWLSAFFFFLALHLRLLHDAQIDTTPLGLFQLQLDGVGLFWHGVQRLVRRRQSRHPQLGVSSLVDQISMCCTTSNIYLLTM
jgi:hypothetical protein